MSKNALTPVDKLRWYFDRAEVPDYIPDEQVARYKALMRQRKCDDGNKRKKEKRSKKLLKNEKNKNI